MIEYNPWWRRFFTREGRLLAKLHKLSNKVMWIEDDKEREPYLIKMQGLRYQIAQLQKEKGY